MTGKKVYFLLNTFAMTESPECHLDPALAGRDLLRGFLFATLIEMTPRIIDTASPQFRIVYNHYAKEEIATLPS
jgi:hypothetical protein